MSDVTIGFVLDKSGSMQAIWDDTIGAFNAFRSSQACEPGRTALSLTLFDSYVRLVHSAIPIEEVTNLSLTSYVPGGQTALYDAVGLTIEELQGRGDLPERVLLVMLTDGQENASRIYNRASLSALIDAKKRVGWDFLYLGTGIENWADARALGAQYLTYRPDGVGIAAAFCAVSAALHDFRGLGLTVQQHPVDRVK